MKSGQVVREFEVAFADYVGAKHAIALCNGTATLHTALLALGVEPGDRVAVPPLTMSATTLAVLHAGAVPVFMDVDPRTWLMAGNFTADIHSAIPVSLYGLHQHRHGPRIVDDAAQTLRPHNDAGFTSYSFQASKILALGEGGMLVTNDEGLAEAARSYSSLGYLMAADRPGISKDALKFPGIARHVRIGWNYRMDDITASAGLEKMRGSVVAWRMGDGVFHQVLMSDGEPLAPLDSLIAQRRYCASLYADAIAGCGWLTPQHVPEGRGGWPDRHDYWAYAVAVGQSAPFSASIAHLTILQDTIVKHGGERPYPAWRLAYQEPALTYLALPGGQQVDPVSCPVAEDLQPRLLQFQTNNLASAERNAAALKRAIEALS